MRTQHGLYVGGWPLVHRRTQEWFGKQERSHIDAIALIEAISLKANEVKKSRDLTDSGKRKALRDWVKSTVVPKLKAIESTRQSANNYGANKRAGLTVQPGDRTDVVAALLRQELRAYLRASPIAERAALLAMPEVDPNIAIAVMEAPIELSGVSADQRQRMEQRAVLAANPETGRELLDLDQASACVLMWRCAPSSRRCAATLASWVTSSRR
jgi:hypothetical protein